MSHKPLAFFVLVSVACGPNGTPVAPDTTGTGSESSSETLDEECPELVWVGRFPGDLLWIETAEHAANLPRYTRIEGALRVDAPGIRDLGFLECLSEVTWGFAIACPNLESLDGIERLESAESLGIVENQVLRSLEGLGGIDVLPGDLSIRDNPLLESTAGLRNLREVELIDIKRNDSLVTIDLPGLESFEDMFIGEAPCGLMEDPTPEDPLLNGGNPYLVDLDGLSSLVVYGYVHIRGNPSLISLEALLQAQGEGAFVEFNPMLPYSQVEELAQHIDDVSPISCGNLDEPTPCECEANP